MLKPIVPVLFALAALATPAEALPPSPFSIVAEMKCQELSLASSPITTDTTLRICPTP